MNRKMKVLSASVILWFIILGCGLSSLPIPPTLLPIPTVANEPYKITGSFTFTNGFVFENYFVENAVALVDMHGFVVRDNYWELPIDSQVLGYMNVDLQKMSGTYELNLPERPEGVFNDVDNNGKTDTGVQIYTVSYFPNLAGGPFSEGDDPSYGWPNYFASVVTDATNNYEVTGGKLVVWAPDANQEFPTGFGPDGKLFTADDPVAPIPAGYTIVDLDQKPFEFIQQAEPTMTLYEPKDFALKDFSGLSYTESFDKLFQFVRLHYAFNGYADIEPNWDALYAELNPRVQQAESNHDANAFWLALRDLTWAFKDGHVGLSSTAYGDQLFTAANTGGYGFAIRELDDGRVVVIYVLDSQDSPAKQAGIQVGAVVTEFNSKPIKDAIGEVIPWTGPTSSAWDWRYEQARYLLRASIGTDASLTFTNPGGDATTVTLKAIDEHDSFVRTDPAYDLDTTNYLPVDFSILDSGIGYVKITSYSDDLNLIIRLFKRAMDTFKSNQVPGIIIDLRYNFGGNPLGLAAFLTDQEIPLPQGYSYNETSGKFEPDGVPGRIYPNVEQYTFGKMAVLVGPTCYSACEEEAYSFSQVPGMMVVGMYPSNGSFADVGDGQIAMPDGISMQFPTERFLLADGSLFLQGQGVQPTVSVPFNEQTTEATNDVVLQAAENSILNGTGASAASSNQANSLLAP
jgi:C-terminal processing protease CtpA/Prc